MKTITTLSIDVEVLRLAKEKYPNKLSKLVNDYLKEMLKDDLSENYSRDQLKQEIKDDEQIIMDYNTQISIKKEKMILIDKKEIENKETQQKLKEDKQQDKEIGEELKEPLTLKEIQFFNDLNPKSNDVFNMNYYNNTFYRQFNEKQYLKRFKKFTDEIKPLPRLD